MRVYLRFDHSSSEIRYNFKNVEHTLTEIFRCPFGSKLIHFVNTAICDSVHNREPRHYQENIYIILASKFR
jgi:hypothetical protein